MENEEFHEGSCCSGGDTFEDTSHRRQGHGFWEELGDGQALGSAHAGTKDVRLQKVSVTCR